MSGRQGWVPRQHGAWAMLIVPFVTGVVLRSRVSTLDPYLIPLGLATLTGYLGFNTLTFWLKAAPRRRHTYLRPLIVYGAVTGLLATVTLLLGGWVLLGWLPVALPFMALAIWLASHRKERAVVSGFATVALAVGVGLAVRFPRPARAWQEWPQSAPELAIFLALFCYFFGTVYHVKALIRERGRRAARLRTLVWHLGATALAAVGAQVGWLSVWWIGFFALTTVRTWLMTEPERASRLKPLPIGVLEIALSIAALLIVLFA